LKRRVGEKGKTKRKGGGEKPTSNYDAIKVPCLDGQISKRCSEIRQEGEGEGETLKPPGQSKKKSSIDSHSNGKRIARKKRKKWGHRKGHGIPTSAENARDEDSPSKGGHKKSSGGSQVTLQQMVHK